MAMTARPVPQDPYNPTLHASDAHDSGRYPSPLIPIRLPIFAIVIWLNDILVRALSITGSVEQKRRHYKVPSNSSEKAEEGAGIEMGGITSNGARQEHYKNARRPVERTKVHSRVLPIDRRKHD